MARADLAVSKVRGLYRRVSSSWGSSVGLGDDEGDVVTKHVIAKCGRRGNRTLNLTVTRVKIERFKQIRYFGCIWFNQRPN